MDILDSFKGAGVIGTFLGAFVLIGFVFLSLLVFDPRFATPFTSDTGIVRDQAQAILRLEADWERLRDREKILEERRREVQELETILRSNETKAAAVQALAEAISSEKRAIEKIEEAHRDYRSQYRAKLRKEAAGETMEELVTAEGKILKEVVIVAVSPVGLHVRHRDGTARIAFTNLSTEIQQRFQFDLEEMETYLESESRGNLEHERMIDGKLSEILAERRAARSEFLMKRVPLLKQRVWERSQRLASRERFSSQFELWRLQELEARDREELQRLLPEYQRLMGEAEMDAGIPSR